MTKTKRRTRRYSLKIKIFFITAIITLAGGAVIIHAQSDWSGRIIDPPEKPTADQVALSSKDPALIEYATLKIGEVKERDILLSKYAMLWDSCKNK